jgi:hypothetical protein
MTHVENGAKNSYAHLRLNPYFHALFLDGVYAPDRDGKGQMFHPAPGTMPGIVAAEHGRRKPAL